MKTVLQLALGALIGLAISSCWVDRKSSDFACTVDEDCASFTPSRVCDTSLGYCVPGDNMMTCPDECNGGCDKTAKTCTINCTNPTDCAGGTICPPGYDCTINCSQNGCDFVECNGNSDCKITCTGNNACGNVDCGDGGACTVTCVGNNACNNVDCNGADCNVTCTGSGACNDVDCDNACACDVQCMIGSSCDSRTCSADPCVAPSGCVSTQTGCPSTCN